MIPSTFFFFSRLFWLCWVPWISIWIWGSAYPHPWVGEISWRRERLPTPVFWPGEPDTTGGQNVWASLVAQRIKCLSACSAGDLGSISGSGRSPGEGNGNPLQYSLAWKMPQMEETARLQSMGSPRVAHDWPTSLLNFIAQLVKNLPAIQETLVWFLGWEDALEKG